MAGCGIPGWSLHWARRGSGAEHDFAKRLVLLVSWLTIDWMGPTDYGDAWAIGLLWVGLTLSFEFLAGHYLFKKSWAELLTDYDLTRGRIWVVVLVVALFAPLWSMRLRTKPG